MNKFLKIFQVTIFFAIVFLLTANIVIAAVSPPDLKFGQDILGLSPADFGEACAKYEGDGKARVCQIDWIGKYIAGIYRYGISLAAVLAVVAVMFGGFVWLSSAGKPDKIKTAQGIIGGAFAGLFLALFSFIILQTVNPRLVSLDPLEILSVKEASFQTPESEGYTCRGASSQSSCDKICNDNFKNCDRGSWRPTSCDEISSCPSTARQTESCCVMNLIKLPDGEHCTDDSQCESGICHKYWRNKCRSPLPEGKPCNRDIECINACNYELWNECT